ncbi:MAG: type IV pili methyl-accepting chemotaxis transducer N-terminal domain-containing protein [Gammaproteobacteria bacterium]|nr:type IV pili methyl-accepting chemotaxis transducer N-terminal domain-containing protein [Gammaproteobacteria bacterium]
MKLPWRKSSDDKADTANKPKSTKAAAKKTGKPKRAGTGRAGLFLTGILILAFIVVMVVIFNFVTREDGFDARRKALADEQQVLSQRIAKHGLEAARGVSSAFGQLLDTRNRFELSYTLIAKGDPSTNLPAVPATSRGELERVRLRWVEFSKLVDGILANRDAVLSVGTFAQTINDQLPQLLALSDELVGIMVETGASPYQVYIASRQLMLSQRIGNSVQRVLTGGEGAATAADRFGRDAFLFGRVLQGMLRGDAPMNIQPVEDPDALEKLAEVAEVFSTINDNVGAILEKSPELFEVQDAASRIGAQSDTLLDTSQTLGESFARGTASRQGTLVLAYLAGLAAMLMLIVLFVLLLRGAQKQRLEAQAATEAAERTNRDSQEAIQKLLFEIEDLANGDLTVQATVSEAFTGHIADAFNYVVESLRNLVRGINETAETVSVTATETQDTARQLALASERQAEQITDAGDAINRMADTITSVSTSALESAEVARRSVDIAHTGAETVRRTIQGMDSIREQIQETSKRIKRLGESSQEIGDIVELINDIADQTNILALNASIQAAMAGEAGRGFAVVADEVQRLAERSADATKQIEALVQTIQSDTNEAVSSMEQSTAGVVQGAKLAEDAGEALQQIESVSQELADLIVRISEQAREQAEAAATVNDTMLRIQEVTVQTSNSTGSTADSISQLAKQVAGLKSSVAGFRLPD